MSEISYFREFSAQISQIVFLAYLTVSRLVTIVWPEMNKNTYLRKISARVPQNVLKRSNKLRKEFVILVHWIRGDMSYLTFQVIQLK